MDEKDFAQLEALLYKKKQRFVDMLLWQLHLDGVVNKFASAGVHDDIRNCIQSLRRKYCDSSDFPDAKDIIEYYIKKCNRNLIPEEHLDWLDKKDHRQCNFVWLYLKNNGVLNPSDFGSLRGNSDKHYISIRAMDLFPGKMPSKIKGINEIREAWQATKDYTGWQYSWLNIHDESQCKKAINFLSKKISDKSRGYLKPPLIQDDNELNDYYKFLASVDSWSTLSIAKQNFAKKISDTARKWKTPEQKKAQIKLKNRAKDNNYILLKDKKLLKELQSIQEKMGHKTPIETLKHIINEQKKRNNPFEADEHPAKNTKPQKDEVVTYKHTTNDKKEEIKPSNVELNKKQKFNIDIEARNKNEESNESAFKKKLADIASDFNIPPPPKSNQK